MTVTDVRHDRDTLHTSANQQSLHLMIPDSTLSDRAEPNTHTLGRSLEKGGLHDLTFCQKQSYP